MKIKYINNTKELIAMKLEEDGSYVSEDINNNVFAINRDSNGYCKFTCIYGATYFIFSELEIELIYNAVKTMAINNEKDITGYGSVISDGWAYNKYKTHSSRQIVGKIVDKGVLGVNKLYCTKKRDERYYFLESGGRRIGGTIQDWNKTVDDLYELKEQYGIWERSM